MSGEIPDRQFEDFEGLDIIQSEQIRPRGYCGRCERPSHAWWIKQIGVNDDEEINALVCCDCGRCVIYEDGYYKEREEDDDS